MPKDRQTFRQTGLKRAIKAALAAEVEEMRAEIDSAPGNIVLVLLKSDAGPPALHRSLM